jgi:MFS transporter, OFA family, oxalate/formate antiporter
LRAGIPVLRKPFYGWTIVGVTFLIGATEAGAFQNILSVFLKPMSETFGWSRAVVSGAMAFGSFGAGALSPFIGPFLDRHGPRMVAFWGVLVLSAGLVAMSSANHIWQLYLYFGVGRMVAVGALSLVISVTVSNWFIRQRGRAMGITWLGPRIGSAILPALAQFFIMTQGWRVAWAALGILVFIVSGIPSLLFLRRRPEDIGLLPDGRTSDSNEGEDSDLLQTGKPGSKPSGGDPEWTRAQAIRTSAFWTLTIVCSLAPFAQAGINFHTFPFLTDQGLTEVSSVLILSTMASFGALGAIGWGVLAERFSVKSLLAINGIGSGLVFFLLFVTAKSPFGQSFGNAAIFILAAIHGFMHGGRLPMLSIIWADYYGRSALGSIYGFSSPFRFTANAIGPIFAAFCFDFFGNYDYPFYFFVIMFLALGMISFTIKTPVHSEPKIPMKGI